MRRELGSVLAVAAFVAAAAACGGPKNVANEVSSPAAAPPETTITPTMTPATTTTAAGVKIPPNLPAGLTSAMIFEGDSIFHRQGNCFTCHGENAKGTTLAPDLTTTTASMKYPAIEDIVTKGMPKGSYPGPMPPRGGSNIDDRQVKAVAAYVWSLSHPQGGP